MKPWRHPLRPGKPQNAAQKAAWKENWQRHQLLGIKGQLHSLKYIAPENAKDYEQIILRLEQLLLRIRKLQLARMAKRSKQE